MVKFRFQDLEVWKKSIEIANRVFDIADGLERRRLYRFAEQLRGAGMSISNNIAEGSGADSKKDFARYLGFARKSVFENANILLLLSERGLIPEEQLPSLLDNLDALARKVKNFQKSLD